MPNFFQKIKDNFFLNFVFLFFFILILKGSPVPGINEYVYLLSPVKQWDNNFLLNDWTFSKPDSAHFIFNIFISPLFLLFSPETVGWIGRIICWSLTIIALFQIGKHFLIPMWLITISILIWLLQGQAIVGDEWIFWMFEAKCVSYIFLLFSINEFIKNRVILPSILLGLSFSFHASVGFFGGCAVIFTLFVLRYPVKKLTKIILITILFSLPGLIPLLPVMFGSNNTSEDWKFMSLIVMRSHLDPFSWVKRNILSLYILLMFNWLHFRQNRNNHALRFLISFQVFICIFFSLGLIFRYAEEYEILRFFPFRLFPLFVPLFFFFHLMSAYYHRSLIEQKRELFAIGLIALLALSNPIGGFVDQVRENYKEWTVEDDDLIRTFKWLSENTPNGAIVISPPWRRDNWYFSKRAQIACWYPSYERFGEWRERIEAMTGDDLRKFRKKRGEPWSDVMEPYYNKLTEKDIESIMEKYRANYLVSKQDYIYPILFNSGTYKVYSLKEYLNASD
ncbi:MAG: hypothetical protein AB1638_10625 [Nitrospirota bacterium]